MFGQLTMWKNYGVTITFLYEDRECFSVSRKLPTETVAGHGYLTYSTFEFSYYWGDYPVGSSYTKTVRGTPLQRIKFEAREQKPATPEQ